MNGRKLKQISTDQCSLISTAASQDASRFYVADFKNGLIVPDNKRHVVTSFNGEQLLRIDILMKQVGC
jgi:hypothetical protein